MIDWFEHLTDDQRSELAISLEHRLDEAVAGNAYVWTEPVAQMLVNLAHHHSGLVDLSDYKQFVGGM